MKTRDVEHSPAMRRLSLFASCTCCDACKGFRPRMDGVKDDDAQQRGFFYFDISVLEQFDIFEACRDCKDSIKHHMDSLSTKTPEEIEYFGEMAKDASTVHKWMLDNEDVYRFAALSQTYQIMMDALSKCSFNHLPHFGEPQSDAVNAAAVLTNYICSLELDTEESEKRVRCAFIILSDFNAWTIPSPKDFVKIVPEYDAAFYSVFYTQWLLLAEFPRRMKSMKQHEAPDVFDGRALHAFLKYYLNTLPKEHDEDVAAFASGALAFCEASLMNDTNQRLTLPPDVEPLRYARSGEGYEYGNLLVKGKKQIHYIEPLSRKVMLNSIVKIVQRERLGAMGSAGDRMAGDMAKTEAVKKDLETGVVEFRIVRCTPDPCQDTQELAWILQLKNLFCEQIPNLGDEYVARLLFDQHHQSLALIRSGNVVAGICFRPFPTQGFMEIVFLAVAGSQQVKGYGTVIMNALKDYSVRQGCYNLMTYADLSAMGYFGKQGFSDTFDMPKETYDGFLKFYSGATLVACRLHETIPYGGFFHYIKTVRDMHRALRDGPVGGLDDEEEHIEKEDDSDIKMRQILQKLKDNEYSVPFLAPVSAEDVPEYHKLIKYPMDLQTMTERVEAKYYVHVRLFVADLCRMFANCYKFNGEDSEYYQYAYIMNELALELVQRNFPDSGLVPRLPVLQPRLSRS